MQRTARVCAVITEETTAGALRALQESARVADLAEIRLDYLRDFDFGEPRSLSVFLERQPLPVIITCRDVDEGGHQALDNDLRLRLLAEASRTADYSDVEAVHYARLIELGADTSRLIVSYHNFKETPADLDSIYDRLVSFPAAIHKIATLAQHASDCLAHFKLLERAQRERRDLIAIAMGHRGIISRLLGPSRGSFLTYGSFGREKESAAGQLTCREMTRRYRIRDLSTKTRMVGIIGRPVAHSASPAMHNAAFAETGLDFVYVPFEVDDVNEFVRRMILVSTTESGLDFRGLSVTIPHKSAILNLVDELDPIASAVGAVNTLVIDHGKLHGYNTDVRGMLAPLAEVLSIEDHSFAVIGAGGAARAVICGLKSRGARVEVFARDPARASGIAGDFDVKIKRLDDLHKSEATVLINATPVGMHGHSEGVSPVSPDVFEGRIAAYDLIYNPAETQFLKDARERGCLTLSGMEMLVTQAAAQFELWTGRSAPVEAMRKACLEYLAES